MQGGDPVLHLGEHARGERAPAGRQQQFDPDVAGRRLDRAHQPHVHDRDALLAAARVIHVAERVQRPLRYLGHEVIVRLHGPAR